MKIYVLSLLLLLINFLMAHDESKIPDIPQDVANYIELFSLNNEKSFKDLKKLIKTKLQKHAWEFHFSYNSKQYGLYHVYKLDDISLIIYGAEQADFRVASLQKVWSSSPKGMIVDDVAIYKKNNKFSYDDKVVGKGLAN